jgi:hypothetical protein
VTPETKLRTLAVAAVAALVVVGTSGAVAATGAVTATTDDPAAAQDGQATTAEESGISIRNLSSPDPIRVGTNYTVSATVVNRGDGPVTERVNYQIAANVIETKSVRVTANNSTSVQFDITESDTAGFPTGTFVHGVFSERANATANVTLVEGTTTPATTTVNETTGNETPATETTEVNVTSATETTENETPATETTAVNVTATTAVTGDATTEATANDTTAPAEAATVQFTNQDSNGSAVTVRSVTLPDGGFVVVHNGGVVEGEAVESIVGRSDYLSAGTHRNVTVALSEPIEQSQRLVAVLYRDSNDNKEYDFVASNRTADGPYTEPDSPEAVNQIAIVTVVEQTTNATA